MNDHPSVLDMIEQEKHLREQIAKEIESIKIEASIENAVGMRIMAASIARGNDKLQKM